MRRILLVEPDYPNKYPPLGLMKISRYHKHLGDDVCFVKGCYKEIREQEWDRIYITTLFTFYWDKSLKTIEYYIESTEVKNQIYVGGVLATIQFEEMSEVEELDGITIIPGLLDRPGMLDDNTLIVDEMTPDYSIINDNELLDYEYPVSNSYICYATRGCIRKCAFCVVHTIEPNYKNYICLRDQVESIEREYGPKRDLMLMDNNILASSEFDRIIDEIKELGYGVDDNYYRYKKGNRNITVRRYVDFNQGIDARLLTNEKAKKLSEIAVKPLRIAFDHANDSYVKLYTEKIRLSANLGMKNLSNYVLYNFEDTPEELYKRLEINVSLNEEFAKDKKTEGSKIFSFPMRYSPITGEGSHGRKFVGEHWNWKYIRTIQCILNATHGVVGPKRRFFNRSFGDTIDDFKLLLVMPEDYIVYRSKYEENGYTGAWKELYFKLLEKYSNDQLIGYFDKSYVEKEVFDEAPDDIKELLKHYKVKKGNRVVRDKEYNV